MNYKRKTKQVSITLTDSDYEKLKNISEDLIGTINISAAIRYLINNYEK